MKTITVHLDRLPPDIAAWFAALVGLPNCTLPQIRLIDCPKARENIGKLAAKLLKGIVE